MNEKSAKQKKMLKQKENCLALFTAKLTQKNEK